MNRDKPIIAVVCGLVRQEFELYTTLGYLCDYRSRGMIDGIILSTWTGEADRKPELRAELAELGVELVESAPLDVPTPYGNLNYLRQARQMKAALGLIPDGATVLKSRTDFSNFDFNRNDQMKDGIKLLPVREFGEFDSGFLRRLSVLRCGVTCPFSFHDITYIAGKSELRKLCTTDNSMLSVGSDVGPDIWLFAPYFAMRYPIIDDFFRYIDNSAFLNHMLHLPSDRELVLPEALNKFFALYFVLLYQCISIYHEESFPEDEELSLGDVFRGREGAYLRRSWLVEIRSEEIICRIVLGRLKHTEGYKRLYRYIERIREKGYAESLSITCEDYEELKRWGWDFLGLEADKWLKSYRKLGLLEDVTGKDISFARAERILFSDVALDDEMIDELSSIAYDNKSYYGHIISSLPVFEKNDRKLYKKALFTASRYVNDSVIRRIAEMLMEEELTETELIAALYPFQRYARDNSLYGFPMTADRVMGLYTYCLYEDKVGDNPPVVRTEWYRRLWGLLREKEPDTSGDESFDFENTSMDDLRKLLDRLGYEVASVSDF